MRLRRAAIPVLVAALAVWAAAGCGKGSSGFVYRVPSGSMNPTLRVGERVVVRPGAPKVGEIVVFHPPVRAELEQCGPRHDQPRPGGAACSASSSSESREEFVKRIVAGPGDRLYVREGHVYREPPGAASFTRESDLRRRPCATSSVCDFPKPITVPHGDWYLMGDNRGESDDSRFWGPVPAAWILGVVKSPG